MKILIAVLLATVFAFPQEEKKQEENKPQMKQYFMVLLKSGPNKSLDSLQLQEIQKGHMDNINKLAAEKKLVMAGPFGDNTELRGIFIFDVETMEEAVKLTESDPAVIAGRLVMEIHPWWSMQGTCLP